MGKELEKETNTPWHPGYGLTDETRRKILADAEVLGVKQAAALHGVTNQVIYHWRKQLRDYLKE